MDTLITLLEGGTKCPWRELQRQSVEQRLEGKTIQRLPHLGIHTHNTTYQTQTLLCVCQQDFAWYEPDLLRGSASAWQIQKWMLTVICLMEYRAPSKGARESTQGAEGVCSPIGGTTIWTNQYPQSSLSWCVSNCICSRGWPSRSSMGQEFLGPVQGFYASV